MKRVKLNFGEADSRFGGCCFQAGWAERSVLSLLFVSDQKLSFTSSLTNEMALFLYSSVLICSVILVLEYSVE